MSLFIHFDSLVRDKKEGERVTTAILGVYLYTSSSFIGEMRCYWLEMKRVTSSSVFHGNFKQSEEQGDMGGASA